MGGTQWCAFTLSATAPALAAVLQAQADRHLHRHTAQPAPKLMLPCSDAAAGTWTRPSRRDSPRPSSTLLPGRAMHTSTGCAAPAQGSPKRIIPCHSRFEATVMASQVCHASLVCASPCCAGGQARQPQEHREWPHLQERPHYLLPGAVQRMPVSQHHVSDCPSRYAGRLLYRLAPVHYSHADAVVCSHLHVWLLSERFNTILLYAAALSTTGSMTGSCTLVNCCTDGWCAPEPSRACTQTLMCR
jgi:hypothetical protein